MSAVKTFWTRLFVVLAVLGFAGAVAVRAEDLGAVKQRLQQRVSAIDGLKARGLIGENNRGYLEARGSLAGADSSLMSAENADRGTVYAAIAQQTGTASDQVGRARAKKIAENSKPGVWLQKESGEWYKK